MKVLVIHGAGMNMRGKGGARRGHRPRHHQSRRIHPRLSRARYRDQPRESSDDRVHISNPARRGTHSDVLTASQGGVAGFGIVGYDLALRGLKALLTK